MGDYGSQEWFGGGPYVTFLVLILLILGFMGGGCWGGYNK